MHNKVRARAIRDGLLGVSVATHLSRDALLCGWLSWSGLPSDLRSRGGLLIELRSQDGLGRLADKELDADRKAALAGELKQKEEATLTRIERLAEMLA